MADPFNEGFKPILDHANVKNRATVSRSAYMLWVPAPRGPGRWPALAGANDLREQPRILIPVARIHGYQPDDPATGLVLQ